MKAFQFYYPTKIVFGPGEFEHIGRLARELGKTAMLVEQDGPLEKMGVYSKAKKFLEQAGLTVYPFDGISSNPKLSRIKQGVKLAKQWQIDVVVAVGGGSCIDAAKAISIGALDDGELWDFWARKRFAKAALPVLACSTISATGAETSCHSVVTNDENPDPSNWQKWGLHEKLAFPKIALIDPKLLTTVPRRLTAAGMADTISHILEGYFDGVPYNPISDRIGEGIIMTVIENKRVLDYPNDIEARSAISWAATLAMSGLHDCGRSNAGFPAHWIQHSVGAITDTSHGEGLAVINPAWLEYVNKRNPEKFVQFAERVFKLHRTSEMSDVDYGQLGIEALKAEFRSWGLPGSLSELGVTEKMIPDIIKGIEECPENYPFPENSVEEVLRSCL